MKKNKLLHMSIGIMLIIVSYLLFEITMAGAGRKNDYFFLARNIYILASILISFTISRMIPATNNKILGWVIRIFVFAFLCFLFYFSFAVYLFSGIFK